MSGLIKVVVDAHVGKSIFDNCIMGALKDKTRVLVTHQLQFVSKADLVIVMKDGKITEIGSYDELMSAQGGI
jgi:ATP-binding cassette subfamily C (CFTR/MRP) protein 1